jgi:pimeloyl-ACP methyl ester carboxylesterase
MRNSASTMRHDETTVTVAGAPVRCYRAGAGPALVLLHGGGHDSAPAAWAPVWPALTPHARLVAPDLPGHGGSPLGPTTPTAEGYRTWLLAFLDTCGIGRATIAGRSLGAAIALRTALDAPSRVEQLVLLTAAAISDRELAGVTCPVLLLPGYQVPRDALERIAQELIAFLARGPAGDQ